MEIVIKNSNVYNGENIVGELSTFCCGTDLRIKDKPNALFSILKVRRDKDKLQKCVEALLSIKIPDIDFHWNFTYETANNEELLSQYEKELNNKHANN